MSERPPEIVRAIAHLLRSQCNKIVNGQCMTLSCLNRGGHVKGLLSRDIATCEPLELLQYIERLEQVSATEAIPETSGTHPICKGCHHQWLNPEKDRGWCYIFHEAPHLESGFCGQLSKS